MKKLLYTLVAASAIAISGCYYDKEEELYPNSVGSSSCDTASQTYTTHIKSIIDSKCATSSCHVAGAQSPDLSTYQGVVNNIARVKVRAIDDKTMPSAAPLPACEINKITAWINAGKPQ